MSSSSFARLYEPDSAADQDPSGAMTLREFFRRCYAPLRLAGCKPGTRQQYEISLNHLGRCVGRDPILAELTPELVTGCLAGLIDRGRSPATANKYRAHLLALWRYADRRGLVAAQPQLVERFREPKHLPMAWRIEDVVKILKAAAESPGDVEGIPAAIYWPVLLLTIYETGLRITPVMRLGRSQFDGPQKTIFIPADDQKQKADQLLDLSAETAEAVEHLLSLHGRDAIFPWPFDQTVPQWPALTRGYRKILCRAGLPTGRKDLFHRIRKTTASYIEAAGGNATWQLGHSSRSVTAVYLDPRICRRPRQVDLLPRPAAKLARQLTLF